ncbi:tRNA 2-selenouridine(34) synthase MnmH [Paenibacillus sp. J5C_2022]|uniref:tRNA 2-selenouridine(34) synthase MnmH n=1 Tax=Paenibacillus sp. J5C2022 TaxID=2977129 RepID=UPI0021CE05BD|nr:tRNA 2-selenouridine(34) synthase MnmH [Paenibacillus sp. J5C2022]MCU6707257.1 tRNA 2-selenouridine(34) synthase MnmH [Paenibacillus sp. J5C2022]
MLQNLTIDEWRELRDRKHVTMIDVRSPSEFRNATIPGAINIPIFDDSERAEIGTLYKQVSIQAAKEKGLEIVSAKLPSFVKQFQELSDPKAVFCWRGGMRSKTSATLLSLMDIHAYRLQGGYRAYRQWVLEELRNADIQAEVIVVNGLTGTGKTAILRKLKQEGYPVLDLEGMAGHRGSIFGGIGLAASNQKTFDAWLVEELKLLQHSPYILIEAENRRIGKIALPDVLMRKRETGRQIVIELPLQERVRQIMEDYRPQEHADECLEAFRRIRSRIHTPIAAEIEQLLQAEQYEAGIEQLLVHYYDPRYIHSSSQYGEQAADKVNTDTMEDALLQVKSMLGDIDKGR